MRRSILGVVVAAVVLPALLAACDPGETGAAALVGPARLSERQVQADTQATITAMGPEAAANVQASTIMSTTVMRFVRHELVTAVAHDKGVTVSDGEVDTLISGSLGTGGRSELEQAAAQQAYVPPSELDQYAHDVLLERKLGPLLDPSGDAQAQQDAVTAEYQRVAKELGVSVSPRYGVFNPKTLMVDDPPNDLSKPIHASTNASPGGSSSPSPSGSPAASSSP